MTDIESLKNDLNLIDQAAASAGSSLKRKTNYAGVNWELGMGVAQSNGDTNPNPFITMTFKGISNDGQVEEHQVTFTPQQFADFTQSISRMQKSISSFN